MTEIDPKTTSGVGGESSQTLDRGLRLVEVLALPEHSHGLSITELSKQLGIGRAMVYRLVATLGDRDWVRHEPGGRVTLGLGISRVSQALVQMLADWARPTLRHLANEVAATAHLTIVDGTQARAIAVVEPMLTTFHVAYRVGSHHPLDQGAAGRAILQGREGKHDLVFSAGELQTSAFGAAVPVRADSIIEASVGVVSLYSLSLDVEGPIRRAAAELAHYLSPVDHSDAP